jgi:hypothetical protein
VLANEQKMDHFASDLCSALVSANYLAKLAFIFLTLTAAAFSDDSAPAKMKIRVKVVPELLATRAECTSQVQATQIGTLATFTLPIEPGYECTEDIQTIQADLKLKAITSTDLASQARQGAVVIRHTYVPR